MLDDTVVCFYSDDTGQKTRGKYFLLAGIAVASYHKIIRTGLEDAESKSKKRLLDWHSTDVDRRIDYLHRACNIHPLRGRIFYRVCTNAPSSTHTKLRTDCLQAAVVAYAAKHRRIIYPEGLTRVNRENLLYGLRRRGLVCDVRSARFERFAEVRLADALAGMIAKVRFSTDGADYAQLMQDWFVEV